VSPKTIQSVIFPEDHENQAARDSDVTSIPLYDFEKLLIRYNHKYVRRIRRNILHPEV
jgi:hypothetical protein